MQIVIDIPERMYLSAKEDALCGAILLVDAIKNGTPLPKGHGRLIDADALKDEWKEGFHRKMVEAIMDDAPTIIEADRSKEE